MPLSLSLLSLSLSFSLLSLSLSFSLLEAVKDCKEGRSRRSDFIAASGTEEWSAVAAAAAAGQSKLVAGRENVDFNLITTYISV
jgi:hypothetical protein